MIPIGGYFELAEAIGSCHNTLEGYLFNSCRNGFEYILREVRPSHVWMPRYTCHVMKEPLTRSGVPYSTYSVDNEFMPRLSRQLEKDEWIVYTNYFGICSKQAAWLVRKYPNNIIIDNSQAFYDDYLGGVASLYSPRKFFGLPDGGVCISARQLNVQDLEIDDSINRLSHLYLRRDVGPEAGYKEFLKNDASLSYLPVRRMSNFTEKLLSSVDWQGAKTIRINNFNHLHNYFSVHNELVINTSNIVAPLCYPLLVKNGASLRKKLIDKSIYIPQYWPEVLDSGTLSEFEKRLISDLVCIPVDQRYGKKEMNYIMKIYSKNG